MKWLAALGAFVILASAAVGALLAARHSTGSTRGVPTGPRPGSFRGSEPPPGIEVPNISLHSYKGALVNLRRPPGKALVLTGVDSDCKTKCPILVSTVAAALRLLSPTERAQTRAIAYSVDPKVDTPANIRRFLTRRRALALDYLVDPTPKMRPLWRSLGVLAAVETGNADIHSADVRVYDRRGTWVSTLHVGVDLTAGNLAHDIRAALEANEG